MKGYTLAELKKKYAEMSKKKGYRGWYEATKENAGNVPLNNAIFNMAMDSAKSLNMAQVNADNFIGDAPAATADGGIGMVGMVESMKMQESVNTEEIISVIRNLGSLSTLTTNDWVALKDDPKFNKARDDLWMYGNEIRALMAYVFEDEARYDTAEMIYNKYAPRIGTSVAGVLKDLKKKEYDEWKANADAKSVGSGYPEDLDEGFHGDERAFIEKISNLGEGEILRLENTHNDISLNEPLIMCIKKNPKFPNKYMLWYEGKESGEEINRINFSSLDNAINWAKQSDEFIL